MKDHLPDTIDGLLIKVILGDASEEENRQVEAWVSSGESNRLYFEHFRKIWDESKKLEIRSAVNEDEAWARFRQRVQSPVLLVSRRASYPWLRIAAAFLILAAASWVYFKHTGQPARYLSLRSGNATRTDTLPDGTIVTLNRNSVLTAEEYGGKAGRSVGLEGEAFFKVAANKDLPFTVHTKDATIRVLGTAFNVKASIQTTEVIVESGLVEIGKEQHFIPVRPHEKAFVSENNALPRKQDNPDELYSYYRTHEFVCNGTTLARLAEVLNEAFNTHIVIADSSLGRLPLTTTFQNQSLDGILDIVAKTFKIKIQRTGDQILLK